MKRVTALVLLAVAFGATMYFLSRGDRQPTAPPESANPSQRDSLAPSGIATPAQRPPPSAPSAERAAQPGAAGRPPAAAARFDLRAPDTVRNGDTFSVTVDVQALRPMRQLEFAVTYRKATLRLLGSAPGAFGQREGTAVQFEESSDGHLLVRVDFESGASTGGGNIALLEFQALKRGVSPLSVQDVSYVEVGSQDTSTPSDVHERSITVE